LAIPQSAKVFLLKLEFHIYKQQIL